MVSDPRNPQCADHRRRQCLRSGRSRGAQAGLDLDLLHLRPTGQRFATSERFGDGGLELGLRRLRRGDDRARSTTLTARRRPPEPHRRMSAATTPQWGYWLDRDTGARWYDPVTGRWVTRDPIGYADGANLYGYCGGGPIGWTDVEGMQRARAGARGRVWQPDDFVPFGHNPGGPERDPYDPRIVVWPGTSSVPGAATVVDGYSVDLPAGEDVHDFLYSPEQEYVDWYNHEMGHVEQARCLGPEWLPAYGRASVFGYKENPYEQKADEHEQKADERAAAQPFGVRQPAFHRNPLVTGMPWIARDLVRRNDA